jgi:hypothetical protein
MAESNGSPPRFVVELTGLAGNNSGSSAGRVSIEG